MNNPNHPKAGTSIKVEPIRDLKDVRSIKKQLAGNTRDLAIFTVGINTKLRASDLVALTVGMVKHLQPGEHFTIRERKTGKDSAITINKTVYEVVQSLLATIPDASDDQPLFQSRKGGAALTPISINKMVKGWCSQINLKGNYGSHTLRKTFGYHHRVTFGTDIPTLMQMFNHSTQRQTLEYLCIQPEEIKNAYMREL